MNTAAQKFAYLFAVLLMLVSQPVRCETPQPQKQDDESWYRNDYECHGYKIVLHTWCRVVGEGDNPFKQCAEQHMEVTGPDGKIKKLHVQSSERKGEFHSIGVLTCVAGQDGKPYVDATLGNGGNCDTCEISAILDPKKGRWIFYGDRWFSNKIERDSIKKMEKQWDDAYRKDGYFINKDMRIEVDYRG